MSASFRQREIAAEVLRAGGTQAAAVQAARIGLTTLKRWLKDDPGFQALVISSPEIRPGQLRRFTTSKASKERIIEALRLLLQLQLIKFQPSLRQLACELRDYQLPDTNRVQDSVIALAIALEQGPEAQAFESAGRIDRRLFRALNSPASSRQPISDNPLGPRHPGPARRLNEGPYDPAVSRLYEPAASARIPATIRPPGRR